MSNRSIAVIIAFSLFVSLSLFSALGQDKSDEIKPIEGLKTMVITPHPPQPGAVKVFTVPIAGAQLPPLDKAKIKGEVIDLQPWLKQVSRSNGLESDDLKPWHIVVSYDEYDQDGDNNNSGVYEEFWAGQRRYKRTYKSTDESNDFNQTDYATEKGLFRVGIQRWPNRPESLVIDPFLYVSSNSFARARKLEQNIETYQLECVLLDAHPSIINDEAPEYCFEPKSSILRYSRGPLLQTVYNEIVSFQGRNVARDVVVTDGQKLHLKLHVDLLEPLPNVEESTFSPPSNAVNLLRKRATGVKPVVLKQFVPRIPRSIQDDNWKAVVEVVVGKNGQVVGAHTVSGPAGGGTVFEDTARAWEFKPFLIQGTPVEVDAKIVFVKAGRFITAYLGD